MTNAEIKSRFAARLKSARATPRTMRKLPLDVYNRLSFGEAERVQWPRLGLAWDIREARKVKPVPDVVQVIQHAAYEEDVRNDIYYGRELARQMRNAR